MGSENPVFKGKSTQRHYGRPSALSRDEHLASVAL